MLRLGAYRVELKAHGVVATRGIKEVVQGEQKHKTEGEGGEDERHASDEVPLVETPVGQHAWLVTNGFRCGCEHEWLCKKKKKKR